MVPVMGGHSKLWLVSAGLLASAAGLAGLAVLSYWQPCSQFLTGTMPREYTLEAGFTPACLAAMGDGPGFPVPGDLQGAVGLLGSVAALLLPLAWLVLLPTVRLSPLAQVVVALPGVLGLALVGARLASLTSAVLDSTHVLIEVSAGLAIVVLGASGVSGWRLVRYAIVLVAATATGLFHVAADYYVTLGVTAANWDDPPGTGIFTVVVTALAAVTTLVLWLHDRHRAVRPEPSRSAAPVLV